MPALRQGLQRAFYIGRTGMLVVCMDHDLIPESVDLVEISGIAPRSHTIQQAPGVTAIDAPMDHGENRGDANAASNKEVSGSHIVKAKKRTRCADFEDVSQAQVCMGVA